jgi:hypothetical protein
LLPRRELSHRCFITQKAMKKIVEAIPSLPRIEKLIHRCVVMKMLHVDTAFSLRTMAAYLPLLWSTMAVALLPMDSISKDGRRRRQGPGPTSSRRNG